MDFHPPLFLSTINFKINDMRNLENKYPNKLKELRNLKKMKLREVTAYLNLKSENRLCRWERGQSYPNVKNLMKLCNLYGVGLHQVYEQSSEIKNVP